MDSGTTKYLIDSNAVRGISIEILQSKKTNNRCFVVIQEVCDEVPNLKNKLAILNHEALDQSAYIKMGEILKDSSVLAVIDYPQNKGSADVALLAHALTCDTGAMFRDNIVIVTDDKGLQNASKTLKINFVSVADFRSL